MSDMRFLLPELMAANGLKTAYALERFAAGQLTPSAAQRLVGAGDSPKRIDLATMRALVRVFGIRDMNDLFDVGDEPHFSALPKKSGAKAKGKASTAKSSRKRSS